MRSVNVPYLPKVDHIRALAALWIVLYHGEQALRAAIETGAAFRHTDWRFSDNPFLILVLEGHTAVGLFMVLSGFIFTHAAYGHAVDYGAFIINRVLRIYPLYLSMLFVGLAAYPGAFDFGAFMATILALADFRRVEAGPFVQMFWAVSVELQFYLLYPFLLVWLNRNPLRFVVAVVGTALMLRILAVALFANSRDFSYFHLAGRIDQFALGMFAAVLLRHHGARVRVFNAGLLAAPLVVLATLTLFHFHGGWTAIRSWKILWPTVEGLMWGGAIIAYCGSRWCLPDPVARTLARIGELSFSIYLLHYPVLMIFAQRPELLVHTGYGSGTDAIVSTLAFAVPVVLAFALVTHAAIEAPFLGFRRRYLRDMPRVAQGFADSRPERL